MERSDAMDNNCKNCEYLCYEMIAARKSAEHWNAWEKPYQMMKAMHSENRIKLIKSNCSFENFIEEIGAETQYTYDITLQCSSCGRTFRMEICVRGTPVYEIDGQRLEKSTIIKGLNQDG